jgi:uncharacterized protein DUF695
MDTDPNLGLATRIKKSSLFMPWMYRQLELNERPAGVLIDDRFCDSAPVKDLPCLVWFGVYCQKEADGGFWHPDETASLDAIEGDLIRLCDEFGRGWAVYLTRIDTHGIREYYLYAGGDSELGQVLPKLQAAHPEYRIEFEETPDAEWNHYKNIFSEALAQASRG